MRKLMNGFWMVAVAGMVLAATASDARSGTAGELDDGFGGDGLVTETSTGAPYAVDSQSNGMVVAAGVDSSGNWRVRRYDTDGTADSSFGESTPLPDIAGAAWDVAVDTNDGILIAGWADVEVTSGGGKGKNGKGGKSETTVERRIGVVRLSSSGDLDWQAFFDPAGNGYAVGEGVALASNGDILVVGKTDVEHDTGRKGRWSTAESAAVVLLRIDADDGSLIGTFGDGGVVVDDVTTADDTPLGLSVQSDGDILVGGWSGPDDETNGFVTAYTSSGSRDTTFGSDGLHWTVDARYFGLAVDDSDRVYACGFSGDGTARDGIVHRLTADGSTDTDFADSGEFVSGLSGSDEFRAVRIDASGNALILARTSGAVLDSFPIRLDGNGDPDSSFGTGGVGESVYDSTGTQAWFFDLALDAAGDVLTAGGLDWNVARHCGD